MFVPPLKHFMLWLNDNSTPSLNQFKQIGEGNFDPFHPSSLRWASFIASHVLTPVNKTVLLSDATDMWWKQGLPFLLSQVFLNVFGILPLTPLFISLTECPLEWLQKFLPLNTCLNTNLITLSYEFSDVSATLTFVLTILTKWISAPNHVFFWDIVLLIMVIVVLI